MASTRACAASDAEENVCCPGWSSPDFRCVDSCEADFCGAVWPAAKLERNPRAARAPVAVRNRMGPRDCLELGASSIITSYPFRRTSEYELGELSCELSSVVEAASDGLRHRGHRCRASHLHRSWISRETNSRAPRRLGCTPQRRQSVFPSS